MSRIMALTREINGMFLQNFHIIKVQGCRIIFSQGKWIFLSARIAYLNRRCITEVITFYPVLQLLGWSILQNSNNIINLLMIPQRGIELTSEPPPTQAGQHYRVIVTKKAWGGIGVALSISEKLWIKCINQYYSRVFFLAQL